MDESILYTIKKMLGYEEEYKPFDEELIALINSFLPIAFQLGVGTESFFIEGYSEKWSDLVGDIDDKNQLKMLQTWLFMQVNLAHDPPASSYVCDLFKERIKEFEWRTNVAVDPTEEWD